MDGTYVETYERYINLNDRHWLETCTAHFREGKPEWAATFTIRRSKRIQGDAILGFDAHGTINLREVARDMPEGWDAPDRARIHELAELYRHYCQPLPPYHDAVTTVAYRRDMRIMAQQRSHVNHNRKPILEPGMKSLYGGGMKSPNDELRELKRETFQELGIRPRAKKDFEFLGRVYDAHAGRMNRVHRLLTPYEDALMQTHNKDPEAIMAALLDNEGLGRLNMNRTDLISCITKGDFTCASMAIFKAFPEIIELTAA